MEEPGVDPSTREIPLTRAVDDEVDLADARAEVAAAEAARGEAEASEDRLQAMVAGLNAIVWERDPDDLRVRTRARAR